MPSPAKKKKISVCLIGDSHLGALKRAYDEKMPEAVDFNVEFYGAPGPEFRAIRLTNGRLTPDESAVAAVTAVNGKGRLEVAPDDFDAVLFFGSRFRTHLIFQEFLHRSLNHDDFVSAAVRQHALARFANGVRSFRNAHYFAENCNGNVFYSGAPFLTDGIKDDLFSIFPSAEKAKKSDRAALWDEVETLFDNNGVTLIRQPENTVTRGCLTKAEFGVDGAVESVDLVHKNAEYGKLILREFYAGVAARMARKKAKSAA